MRERHKQLIRLLNEKGEIDIDTMVELLKASPATVRRDLAELHEKNLITRTLGGARLNNPNSLVMKNFEEKRKHQRAEKEHIAEKASEMVKPGMTIAIDSGTTTWRFASFLKEKEPLTIFTTALAVLEELGAVSGMSILCVGGNFRLKNLDFIGSGAISAFKDLHADLAFIGADSVILGKGIYALDAESAYLAAAIAGCADRTIVVADHSKFNSRGSYQILPENKISGIITDSGLPRDIIRKTSAAPYKLIVAD
jgi:DeoR/GlpR family transcriptional regulator of sugar metabolism